MALLSGEMMVEQRAAVIERFREGKEKVLVTTNVCARGEQRLGSPGPGSRKVLVSSVSWKWEGLRDVLFFPGEADSLCVEGKPAVLPQWQGFQMLPDL